MQNWCNQIFRKSYVTDLILWSEKLLRKRRSVGYKLQFCISAVNRELKAPFCKLANLTLQLNLMHKIDLIVEVEVIVTGTAKSSLCFWKQTNLRKVLRKRRSVSYKLQFCFARRNRELKAPFCKLANFLLQCPARFRKRSSGTWKLMENFGKLTSRTRKLMTKSLELAIVTGIEESPLWS